MNKQKRKSAGKSRCKTYWDSKASPLMASRPPAGSWCTLPSSPPIFPVLSHVNIEIKIRHLLMVLTALPHLEVACLDSRPAL